MAKQNEKNRKGKIGKLVGGLAVLTLVGTTAIAMSACSKADAATPHVHDYTEHTAVMATCEQDGHAAYFTCAGCGKYFDASKVEISGVPTTNATGHAWQITYNDEKGAYVDVCEHDESHTREVVAGEDAEHPLLIADATAWQAAVNADATADYLQLSNDIVLDGRIVCEKSVTIDLNGHSVTFGGESRLNGENAFLTVTGADVVVTINGEGTIDAGNTDYFAVEVRDGAKVVINGGDYIGDEVAVYVVAGQVEINGGSFRIVETAKNNDGSDMAGKEYAFVLNCWDTNYKNGTANIVVTGGQFEHFNPAADNSESNDNSTNFLADGYTVEFDNDTNVYTVVKA